MDSCENSANGESILKIILVARHISKLWKILKIQIMVLSWEVGCGWPFYPLDW